MEPRPASPCTEHTLQQGLLISALLLTIWNPLTTAQLTIESVPSHAVAGKKLLLHVHNLPDNLRGYFWYREKIVPRNVIARLSLASNASTAGPAHTGREIIYHNGSLLIRNIIMNDTGVYILQTLDAMLDNQEASVKVQVYPLLPKPYISSNNSDPVEGKDSVALTCEPETQNTAYQWWINGQNFSDGDRLQLSKGNRILTLLSVLRNDTGPYECGTWNPVSANRSDPVTLNVVYGPDVPIMSPPGSYFRLGTNLTLSCYAASNPPAQYSWLINEEPQSSSQGLFIPNITTEHSGSYTCLVHNFATDLKKTTVKNVTVLAEQNPQGGLPVWAVVITVTGVLVLILVTALGCFLFFKKTSRASVHHDLREPQTPVSFSGPGASDQYAQVPISPREATSVYEELVKPSTNIYDRINHTADVTS